LAQAVKLPEAKGDQDEGGCDDEGRGEPGAEG